ncbi:hypothetical protein [Ruminococcus flavefaciens]|uniref:hypothetical protein n=1 Tax=Ruminococcus flavefaciens TaxID=1265 RepID=UPI00048CD4EB|nr:hypothetical protein [Ruminococcus flavefaciens]
MRTILLSFKSDIYQHLQTGEKIFEHRSVFPDEPIKAYLYISKPVMAIGGVLELSNKTAIAEWKDTYKDDPEVVRRIDKYLSQHKYAMQINSFQDTNMISLQKIRSIFPSFVVPRMYYFIDDSPLLKYLESELHPKCQLITHDFSKIDRNDICVEWK